MGYQTPNIDRIAQEGMRFTDYYAEQSCTAGRASFITGQHGLRTGMTKVGLPAATWVCKKKIRPSPSCSSHWAMRPAQIGKNHLGDRNEYLPTAHGFDEFYGNLYHLNAEEEPELRITRRVRTFRTFTRDTVRAASWTARPPIATMRRSTRDLAGWASRRSMTPVR